MYIIVLTRPDIAFILGYLARYISDLATYYRHTLRELMRYLRSIIKQKLRFSPRGENKHFVIYSDAD